jgi:hypothetical protein
MGVYPGGTLNPGIMIAPDNEAMGKIFVAGTVSGGVQFGTVPDSGAATGGDIDVLYMGYLHGDITVGGNVNAILLREGSGTSTSIRVGKSLTFLNSLDGTLYSDIYVKNDLEKDYGSPELAELEYSIDPLMFPTEVGQLWIEGHLVDYTNNSLQTAQFIGHPSGSLILSGDLGNEVLSSNPLVETRQDYYALSLMAGQTIVVDGLEGDWLGSMGVRLYDSAEHWMGSFGYETVEDEGLSSIGTTPKPMIFTAPAAGVYYLDVCLREDTSLGPDVAPYRLSIENVSKVALAGVNAVGFFSQGTIEVDNGGGIGAVVTAGTAYILNVRSSQGGDIVAFQADSVNNCTVYAGGSIGWVAATTGGLDADIEAGYGSWLIDARICNVSAATDFVGGSRLWATGSIGVIDIEQGDLEAVDIWANSDSATAGGPAGRIDLILVGGNYGSTLEGVPTIRTGPGGDIGYIYVGGTIYTLQNNLIGALIPIPVNVGQTATLYDDNGGTLTIQPQSTTDPTTGLPVSGSCSYYVISTVGAVGGGTGVLARLTTSGSVNLTCNTADKVFQISDLQISGALPPNVTLGGAGTLNVYHLSSSVSLQNVTINGNLLTGDVTGDLSSLTINSVDGAGGSLGELDVGSTQAWLYGPTDAPTADGQTEPQYGWLNGKINGLSVSGNVTQVHVDGTLGNLRVVGRLENVTVNADGATRMGEWDGVEGVVWSGARIVTISVGDGLADDGGSDVARAAIFSSGSIGKVTIKGPRYEVLPDSSDVNLALQGSRVFGELNGSIIARTNTTETVVNSAGVPTEVTYSAIGQVVGTNGAVLTALVLATSDMRWFQCFRSDVFVLSPTVPLTGDVDTVTFSGAGAAIRGMEMMGNSIGSIRTSADSDGISHCRFSGWGSGGQKYLIGEIVGGGGIANTYVDVNGGDLGPVKTLGAAADITSSSFVSTNGMASVSTRNIIDSIFHMPGTLSSVTTSGNVSDTSFGTEDNPLGAITSMRISGSILGSEIAVNGYLGSVWVGGLIDGNSLIAVHGANTGYLKSLTVVGDIGGTITSAGRIGSITSTAGAISADISTVADGWSANTGKWDIALIQTAGGYTGSLSVAGSLKKFVSAVSLGDNPEDTTNGRSQTFDIHENLDSLLVGHKGAPAHLFAEINVGGNIGKMDVDGTFYGRVTTNGNLSSLTLDGSLGGQLDVDHDGIQEDVGELIVYGTISSLTLKPTADIYADLTVGGSIAQLVLNNADIRGDITSLYGSINSIRLTGGSILGKVTAKSIGTVSITNGDIIGDGLSATDGGIKSVTVKGTLNADVNATGDIDALNITGSAAAGHTITIGGNLKQAKITGNLDADLLTGRSIKSLNVGGNLTGSVNAETSLDALTVTGDISGTVRAGGGIPKLTAGSLTGATISSAWNIGDVKVTGHMTNAFLLAGYDAGADGVVGGGDDNPITGSVHRGNIKSVSIGGAMNRSIVAAGIDPGDISGGTYEGFYAIGDNTPAGGISSILKMTVKGGFSAAPNKSAVLADTSIDPVFQAMAGLQVEFDSGATALAGLGTDFGPGVGNPTLTVGALTLTLTGEGTANYNVTSPTTGDLVLEQTGSRSALTITNTGGAMTITIIGSDDSGLASLTAIGPVTLANVSVDGAIGKLQAGAIAAAAVWDLPGGVGTATITTPGNATITVGDVGTWTMTGNFSGNFSADSVKTFTEKGSISGNVSAVLGDMGTLGIGGDFTGGANIRGSVKTLTVTGNMAADVDVSHGDLLTLRAAGLGGVVHVERGLTKSLTVTAGNFTGSYRTTGGVSGFTVTNGSFSGLLSTEGNLGTLQVKGDFSGRVRSAGSITNVRLGSMTSGLMAAAGNLNTVNMTGTMSRSWIFSGFDPGDAGYVVGETGNVRIGGAGAQADTPMSGNIQSVKIGGDMDRSTISAAVGPGVDGYCGTDDDLVLGTGTLGQVVVTGRIYGSGVAAESYGVFAASNMPTVYYFRNRPFDGTSNVDVASMFTWAGPLNVQNITLTANAIIVRFNHAVNMSTVDVGSTFSLLLSTDNAFDPATDTDLTSYLNAPVWDSNASTVTVTLTHGGWQTLDTAGKGSNLQITLDGTPATTDGDGAITDRRGSVLDGEFSGQFPTGNGVEGGNTVLITSSLDQANTFDDAVTAGLLTVTVDGDTTSILGMADSTGDVDIFGFSGTIYDYAGLNYIGDPGDDAVMCLFYRDTQGTAGIDDDTFEAVARYETSSGASEMLTLAYELPATGEYYLAVTWDSAWRGSYTMNFTMTSTDTKLVTALGGLPSGTDIGYVSNVVGEHRNALGANSPKQLVYLNFDGGTATQGSYAPGVDISQFDLAEIDGGLAGRESDLINGSAGVTGIVDNIISIYTHTPVSYPGGSLTVQQIDLNNAADWAAYQAATSGLWFTTVDPATARGLSAQADFTTIFFGMSVSGLDSPGLLGLASDIDLMNQSKADNAVVFSANFGNYGTTGTATERMNKYSRAFATIAAHELGHTLGLNHQPTYSGDYMLISDDPDNNPATPNDCNLGVALMAYAPWTEYTTQLSELGTKILNTTEFPVGDIDTVDLLMRWLT